MDLAIVVLKLFLMGGFDAEGVPARSSAAFSMAIEFR